MLALSPTRLDALRQLAGEEPLRLIVRGDCMEPRLADGQGVRVVRRPFYWPGDVVAFRSAEGHLLVHRVLGVLPTRRGLRLVAQGDARSRSDTPVPLRHVLGRYVAADGAPGVTWSDRRRAVHRCLRHVARTLMSWLSARAS